MRAAPSGPEPATRQLLQTPTSRNPLSPLPFMPCGVAEPWSPRAIGPAIAFALLWTNTVGAGRVGARRRRVLADLEEDIVSQLSPTVPHSLQNPPRALLQDSRVPSRSPRRTTSPARQALALELAEALNRSIEGDTDAFAELYRSTSPRVYGVVLRVLRCHEQAAEVTQEIYLEVWRQAVRYDSTKGGVLTWMTTIAHRRAVDRVRHLTSAAARDHNYSTTTLQHHSDDIGDTVASRLDAAHVQNALARLAPIYQQALGLAYFGGQTQNQIAASLQLPLGTVKTRVRNGLIALRGELLTD